MGAGRYTCAYVDCRRWGIVDETSARLASELEPSMIEVPSEVLDRHEIRCALRSGDWSTVLQILVRETGASQTDIAMAVGVSQPHISRLMNGQSKEPGI